MRGGPPRINKAPVADGAGNDPAASDAATGRDFIAENLRALFANAAEEPLPEALTALLARLGEEEERK